MRLSKCLGLVHLLDARYNGAVSPQKQCPRCKLASPIDAGLCGTCGHIFSTKFVPNQTTVIQAQPGAQAVPTQPLQGYSAGPPQPPQPPQPVNPQMSGYPPSGYQVPSHMSPGYFMQAPTSHSPVIAIILSTMLWFLPGLAHVYNRQYKKAGAFCMLLISVFVAVYYLAHFAAGSRTEIDPTQATKNGVLASLGGAFLLIPMLAQLVYMVDSFCIARKLSEGRFVRDWEFF